MLKCYSLDASSKRTGRHGLLFTYSHGKVFSIEQERQLRHDLSKVSLPNDSHSSADLFSRTKAGRANPANSNYTYHELALISVEKIMTAAGRYAANGNQTKENLIHLKDNIIVGEWRDSTYGEHKSFRWFRKELLSAPLFKQESIVSNPFTLLEYPLLLSFLSSIYRDWWRPDTLRR